MKLALLLAVLFWPLASAVAAQQPATAEDWKVECLPATRAAELLGQTGCIAGRVFGYSLAKNGNQHLTLCPPRQACSFHVVIARRERDAVGDMSHLRGKLVSVNGPVTNYRGHPRIVVRQRDQIHVVAGSPPPEFDVAQPHPPAKGRGIARRNFPR